MGVSDRTAYTLRGDSSFKSKAAPPSLHGGHSVVLLQKSSKPDSEALDVQSREKRTAYVRTYKS